MPHRQVKNLLTLNKLLDSTECHAGPQCQAVSQQLWLLLLQLQGSDESSALSASASQASQLLAEACGMQLSADLAALHAPALISQLAQVHHTESVLLALIVFQVDIL